MIKMCEKETVTIPIELFQDLLQAAKYARVNEDLEFLPETMAKINNTIKQAETIYTESKSTIIVQRVTAFEPNPEDQSKYQFIVGWTVDGENYGIVYGPYKSELECLGILPIEEDEEAELYIMKIEDSKMKILWEWSCTNKRWEAYYES